MPFTSSTNQGIKISPRRWLVLLISVSGILLRAINQSCFGNINNVYEKYFSKAAWQIDWFVVVQAASLMVLLLPMTIVSKKLDVRTTLCVATASSCSAYVLTAMGHLTRNGYSIVLVGQAIEGLNSILIWSAVPLVPAVWFPSNEVSIAVAAHIVGKGIGEAAGSIIPPYIVSMKSSSQQVKWHLFALFASLATASFLMFVLSFLFASGPPTAPSESEEKVQNQRKREQSADFRSLINNYVSSMKTLFTSWNFILLWLVCGAIAPTLRTNNILLSSMIHKAFPEALNTDQRVGVLLAIAWLLYIVGGFIAGPIIARTGRYKEMVCVSNCLLFFSTVLLLIGIEYQSFYIVCSALSTQGFFLGVFDTSIYELLVEVTYPESTSLVSMLTLIIMGCFRVFDPIVSRVLLDKVSATASNALPVVLIFVSFVFILFVQKDYRRYHANNEEETDNLIKFSGNSDPECSTDS